MGFVGPLLRFRPGRGWDPDNGHAIGDIAHDDRAGSDDRVRADGNARQDRGAGADPGPVADPDAAAKGGAGGEFDSIAEGALVVHARLCIHDALPSKGCARLDDRARVNLRAGADNGPGQIHAVR